MNSSLTHKPLLSPGSYCCPYDREGPTRGYMGDVTELSLGRVLDDSTREAL